MDKEKKMPDREQVEVAVKIAEMVKNAAEGGGEPFFILNTAIGLSLGCTYRLTRDSGL